MTPLITHKPARDPADTVEDIYQLADALSQTDKALDFWSHLSADREAALEAILGTYDFLMVGKAVRAFADAWQAELDRAA